MKTDVDHLFELCLLLVTVLAAAELQYVSYVYPLSGDPSSETYRFSLIEVNFIFRTTTIPIIIMIIAWIGAMIFPSMPTKLRGLRDLRRFVKEFCWTLFGNLLALEIVFFVFLGFSKAIMVSGFAAQYGTLLSFVLTLPATWRYASGNRKNTKTSPAQRSRWRRLGAGGRLVIIEHLVIYLISYGIVQLILSFSGVIPAPA